MLNRKMATILAERQAQLAREQQQQQATREGVHSPRGHRPCTAGATQGTRPKVTCAMLNETERMLLKAPNRHKSMLSAGARRAVPPHSRSLLSTGDRRSCMPLHPRLHPHWRACTRLLAARATRPDFLCLPLHHLASFPPLTIRTSHGAQLSHLPPAHLSLALARSRSLVLARSLAPPRVHTQASFSQRSSRHHARMRASARAHAPPLRMEALQHRSAAVVVGMPYAHRHGTRRGALGRCPCRRD
jgi:hypothetical protein